MESSSLKNLTTVKFKSLHNQEIGYADLFAGRRIVIFSLPQSVTTQSWRHLKKYSDSYQQLTQLGIDGVYAVSLQSFVIPFVEIHSQTVVPLHDYSLDFVQFLQHELQSTKNLTEVGQRWQYSAIITDGQVDKLFNNPIKEKMSLKLYLDPKFHYRGVDSETVINYLQRG